MEVLSFFEEVFGSLIQSNPSILDEHVPILPLLASLFFDSPNLSNIKNTFSILSFGLVMSMLTVDFDRAFLNSSSNCLLF